VLGCPCVVIWMCWMERWSGKDSGVSLVSVEGEPSWMIFGVLGEYLYGGYKIGASREAYTFLDRFRTRRRFHSWEGFQ